MAPKNEIVSLERIEKSIFLVRGQRVMLDSDLAELYGVPVKRLNEQVRRNCRRFPSDFMFQLTREEHEALRSRFATLDQGRGKHRHIVKALDALGAQMDALKKLQAERTTELDAILPSILDKAFKGEL